MLRPTQDDFFRKMYAQEIGKIETVYEECGKLKIKLEKISRFPHNDFTIEEQDAFIKLNERIHDILEGDYNLSSIFVDPIHGILDLEIKLKDFVKMDHVEDITTDVNISLMEWRFFLKAIESMFGILQNIHIKYGSIAFQNSYDDEVI